MVGNAVVDTNAAVAILGEDQAISRLVVGSDIFIPTIAVGELYYGAFNSARVEFNVAKVERFIRNSSVLICDAETARIFGEVKARLRAIGRKIPENDVWIAAISLQHELPLVTRDRHFDYVEGLKAMTW